MKKFVIIALLMASTAAYAADAPASTAAAPAAATKAAPKTFDEAKSLRLKHIGDKIAELQKAQTCVTAATSETAMKACNTFHGGKGHGSHHHWHKDGAQGETTAPANSQ